MHSSASADVAIIGMACVFPGAPDVDAFWENLRAGRDAIVDAPPGRIEPLFFEHAGIVQYHLGGTRDRFLETAPMKLLFHFARGWFKERGAEALHLGGGVGGKADALLHFKAGFSPLRARFHTWRIVADSAFGCAGQRCLASSVVITVAEAAGTFTPSIADAAANRKVGYGLDTGLSLSIALRILELGILIPGGIFLWRHRRVPPSAEPIPTSVPPTPTSPR